MKMKTDSDTKYFEKANPDGVINASLKNALTWKMLMPFYCYFVMTSVKWLD